MMRVSVLHLSDIHLKDSQNPITSRANEIAAAYSSVGEEADCHIVAVTGDLAHSGTPKQYSVAKSFFDLLRAALQTRIPDSKFEFCFVPGNHDCNFALASDLRQI